MGKNNAYMPLVQPLMEAGLGKKTAVAMGYESDCKTSILKENIRKLLRIKDEQEFVNKGCWYNTGLEMSSQEVERLLYYKGSLMFFPLDNKFYLMPYVLDGELDYNGRYKYVHPVPIVGSASTDEEKKANKMLAAYLATKKFKVIRDVVTEEDFIDKKTGEFNVNKAQEFLETSCVIINDYTPQLAQKIIPRQMLQEGIIDIEADCIPFMRTALLNSTGVQGMKVNTEDEASAVQIASDSVDMAALNGKKYIPVIGNLDFQDLSGTGVGTTDQFLLAMQALDNFRHSTLGIDNAGLYQKNQFVTDGQNQVNVGSVGLIAQDSISTRQHACDIINSIWGLGIWYDNSELLTGMDNNGDGELDNEQDQSGTMKGQQPEGANNDLE